MKITGKVTGDGECGCLEVGKDEFIRIFGIERFNHECELEFACIQDTQADLINYGIEDEFGVGDITLEDVKNDFKTFFYLESILEAAGIKRGSDTEITLEITCQ